MSNNRTVANSRHDRRAPCSKPADCAQVGAAAATRSPRRVRRWLALTGGVTTGLIVSIGALAQDAANSAASADTAPPPPQAAGDEVQEVTVTGFRKSYADALKIKRDSVQITDSIAEDGLGRFPDLNVGEALARLPGVQINREAGSRDATINLRGLITM